MEVTTNLIDIIHSSFTADSLHFAVPVSYLKTNELDLIHGVLQMLQGFSGSLFYWEDKTQCFCSKSGIFVTHLTQKSLYGVLHQFMFAATCLKSVEIAINKIEKSHSLSPPTLRAFASSVKAWLRRIRNAVLNEEVKVNSSDGRVQPTILGLSGSLSSVCSGAENLLEIVLGAIPSMYFELDCHFPASYIAAHILNHLYMKINEVCLVQGGEEDAYKMLLYLFVGSLFPYIESLDSWLFHGTLDDPFDEMFFVRNKEIAIDETEFWQKSYQARPVPSEFAYDKGTVSLSNAVTGQCTNDKNYQVCPFFIKDMAKAIVSAGKSLQLIRHGPIKFHLVDTTEFIEKGNSTAGLSLSEIFCLSLTALIGDGDHIAEHFLHDDKHLKKSSRQMEELEKISGDAQENTPSEKMWQKLLADTRLLKKKYNSMSKCEVSENDHITEGCAVDLDARDEIPQTFCRENPSITVCQGILHENRDSWSSLNISQTFNLPPLNDEVFRHAIFGDNNGSCLTAKSTDYTSGLQFGKLERRRFREDTEMLEDILPFPTLLPSFQDDLQMSELLPYQTNSTLSSRILGWIQHVEPKLTPPPAVVIQECLLVYIKKQANYIGNNMLPKLLCDWRLLDELGVLRAIYLLGSGDLLHHFLSVIFSKLDKGEFLDDEFELNTILQESIRNSADNVLLSTPDSLVVSLARNPCSSEDEQHNSSISLSTPRKVRGQNAGMDVLDSLTFTYKVSWPLELIANLEALNKYNQVMNFLLKIKRAKFVLDKVRRWMWKDRGNGAINRKFHLLLGQKLLHFVDAFHQYVMDRVYQNAWRELCEGVRAAGSLDEAIEVHEAYLLSIQRQCFVAPDKLWALIASRINTILQLSLDFYFLQKTLSTSGTVSAMKARCEKRLEQIEKQFDDCMNFLLRILSVKLNVGQFPHLAALVTRINYNNFYMSDGGNSISAPAAASLRSS